MEWRKREEGRGWRKARSVFSYSNCEGRCCRAGSSRLAPGEEAVGRDRFTAAAVTVPCLRVQVLLSDVHLFSSHASFAVVFHKEQF